MIKYLIEGYKEKRDLINYFILTYVDKIISFVLPLSILFVIQDKATYNLIEVVISYATIALAVIELGVSNYLFWGYKNSNEKERFVKEAQIFFKFILVAYCLFSFFIAFWIGNKQILLLFILISLRTLFTFYVNFYSNIFRLTDTPSKIYPVTIFINVSSIVLLMIAFMFSWDNVIVFFFLPSAVLLIMISLRFLIVDLKVFKFQGLFKFINNSMTFAWPIILNTLFMSFMNNYAKIYAYGHLNTQEMTQISYVLRIGLIIQLTHAAFSSFYSKSIFMDLNQKFNVQIFRNYSIVLLFSVFLVLMVILITNFFFNSFIQIPLNTSTIFFVLYILVWCYIGYFELYFGVMNANRQMLYYSILSSALYIFLLRWFSNVAMLQLALFMFVTALFNLVLVIIGLKRLRVFDYRN